MNEQSAWRVEFARRYIQPYAEHSGALMAVLGGSVAQGVADRKRVGAVVSRMELVPLDAAARLDGLLDLPRERVKPDLDDLVAQTLELVEKHLPEVDTAQARRIWSLPAEPCEEPPW